MESREFLTPQLGERNRYARNSSSNVVSSLRSLPLSSIELDRLTTGHAPMTELTSWFGQDRPGYPGSDHRRGSTPHHGNYLQVPSASHVPGGYQNRAFSEDRPVPPQYSRSHNGTPRSSPIPSLRHNDVTSRRSSLYSPIITTPLVSPSDLQSPDELAPDYDDDVTSHDQQRRFSDHVTSPLEVNHAHNEFEEPKQISRSSSTTVFSKKTEQTELSPDERDSGAGSLGRCSDVPPSRKEESDALLGDKWDIFRDRPLTNSESCFNGLGTRLIRVTKVLAVGFLFLSVLGAVLLSKLNFFYITEQVGKMHALGIEDEAWTNHYTWYIVLCLSVPDLFKVLQTTWGIVFGKREKPQRAVFIFTCVSEVVQVIALYGVTFKVFPYLTSTKSLILTMATGLIPTITGTIVALRQREMFCFGTRAISTLLQCGSVGLCAYYIVFSDVTMMDMTSLSGVPLVEFRVWCIMGLVLLSLRWLKNYLPGNIGNIKLDISNRTRGVNLTCLASSILRIITAGLMIKVYLIPELGSPIPSMGLTSLDVKVSKVVPLQTLTTSPTRENTESTVTSTAWLPPSTSVGYNDTATVLVYNQSSTSSTFFITFNDTTDSMYNETRTTSVIDNLTSTLSANQSARANDSSSSSTLHVHGMYSITTPSASAERARFAVTYIPITLVSIIAPALTHIGTTWAGNYFAVIACKLCLQRQSFSLPLLLASPLLFLLLQFLPDAGSVFVWGSDLDVMPRVPEVSLEYWMLLTAFALGCASQILMCLHVWKVVPVKRLAFTQQLFIMPHYCAIMADLALLHSRRQVEDVPDMPDKGNHPLIYICATMWHENDLEMMQILTSLFRLDEDQCAKKLAKQELAANNIDYYEFEVHILFDDALCDETREGPDYKRIKTGRRAPNEFVKQLAKLLDEAASEFLNRPVKLKKAVKYRTPYGARVEWTFPGRNKFIVHLKDKDKIRHRKRWSQVMYMYYLLGYKLTDADQSPLDMGQITRADHFLEVIPSSIVNKADNTYILALDGDVDFKPEALHLLVDRMKKNPDVAAACGRIKPKGTGPVVWYQKFEYAIGHWLQKSAEHVFGCVLCSPGCFSLFRGRCLMDDNVMKTYTKKPVTARHHLQYDQGEDRWLCTLLLQQGYRVEYCAASEALTFAPEGFDEFFNQRRRWLPSTMANVLDLLMSRSTTVMKNRSISNLYIFYQTVLFASSVLGPATVLLAIESSVKAVFQVPGWAAYLVVYLPNIVFSFACLKFKAKTQLTIAKVLSTLFALIMMAVIAGTLVSIAQEGWFTPNVIFMYVLVGSFVLSGLMHPHEFMDLVWGVLYFLCIPSGYLFLIIYSICNLNIISWGTREVKSVNEQQEDHVVKKESGDQAVVYLGEAARHLRDQIKQDGNDSGCCSSFTAFFRRMRSQLTVNATLLFILEALTRMERGNSSIEAPESDGTPRQRKRSSHKTPANSIPETSSESSEEIDPTSDWIKTDEYIEGDLKTLSRKEEAFWKKCIDKYLEPLDKNPAHEAKIAADMLELRNNSAFAFFFLNGLWLVIMTALQEVKRELNIVIEQSDAPPIIVQPLGMLFLAVFAVLLVLQMLAMLKHRYGTFLHVLAFTPILSRKKVNSEEQLVHLASSLQKPVDDLPVVPTDDSGNGDSLQEVPESFNESSTPRSFHQKSDYNFSEGTQGANSYMLHRYIQNTSRARGRYRRDLHVSRDQREVVDYHQTFNRVYSTMRGGAGGGGQGRRRRTAANVFDPGMGYRPNTSYRR